jgi:hypothetical protein
MTQELTQAEATATDRENKYKGWSFSTNRHANTNQLDKTIPKITIQKVGVIYINDAALALIGKPNAVLVGFNAEFELIGIQPDCDDEETEGANKYKVSKKLPKDTYVALNTPNYLKSIGYPVGDKLQVFSPELEDGRLVIEVGNIIKKAKEDAALKQAAVASDSASTEAEAVTAEVEAAV